MEINYSDFVRENKQIDICAVSNNEIRREVEKALLKERISYLIRWERPGFLSALFNNAKERIIFCISAIQLEEASRVMEALKEKDTLEIMIK